MWERYSIGKEDKDRTGTERQIDEKDRGQRKNWGTAKQMERLETEQRRTERQM